MTLPQQKRFDSPWYDPKDESALKRMRFLIGRWEQLNWYVDLIAKDLSKLSDGEWTVLQEEIVAAHRTLSNAPNPTAPNRQALASFQQEISRHFSHLRHGGLVEIGPLKITHKIQLSRKLSSKEIPPVSLSELFDNQHQPLEGEVEVHYALQLPIQEWRDWLLNHFGQLLGEYGSSIRQCPHCSGWFLQFRKSAQYCGRTCQNRAGAEAARERKRIEKAKQKRAKAPLKKSTQRKRR